MYFQLAVVVAVLALTNSVLSLPCRNECNPFAEDSCGLHKRCVMRVDGHPCGRFCVDLVKSEVVPVVGGNVVPQPPSGCEPVMCMIHCEHGFATGENGCPRCSCRQRPAVPCRPVMCMIHCEHGFSRDENGCERCSCFHPQ